MNLGLLSLILFAFNVTSGCSSYGVVVNEQLAANGDRQQAYSLLELERTSDASHDISLLLAFSGGGTRAAALAYGVCFWSCAIPAFPRGGIQARLLDEVDVISSVSGGSLTAAYCGLHGDAIFETYEEKFLRWNVQNRLISGFSAPDGGSNQPAVPRWP